MGGVLLFTSDKFEARGIRKIGSVQGYDFSGLNNQQLLDNFRIRKINRSFRVLPQAGFVTRLLETTGDVLSLAAIFPQGRGLNAPLALAARTPITPASLINRALELKRNITSGLPKQVADNTVVATGVTEDGKVLISLNNSAYQNEDLVNQIKASLGKGEFLVPPSSRRVDSHAEENLIYFDESGLGGNNLKHLEVSNPLCQQCEELLKNKNITTTTSGTGKTSASRARKSKPDDPNQLDLFNN